MTKLTIAFFLLSLTTCIQAQDYPIGTTPNYDLRMYGQNSNPSADSINQNWKDIDSAIYKATYMRQGTVTPTLLPGELYYATDINVLYIGQPSGVNAGIFLGTAYNYRNPQAGFIQLTTGVDTSVDCSKHSVIVISDADPSLTTKTITFKNIIEGVMYTIRIHSNLGNYLFEFENTTGNWIDPFTGTQIYPRVNETDVFNFIVFGGKYYPRIYGQGY